VEQVLTVKRELVAQYIPETGISAENAREVVDIILKHPEFLPRPQAEDDPSHKQIIPYVVLCRGNEVFATRRLKKGGETRLHGLISLGVGGHINAESDAPEDDILYHGLHREIDEEVIISKRGALTPRGLINDDTNEVGKFHLGMFFTLEVEGEVAVRETEKLEGFWLRRDQLAEKAPEMETWSQLVVGALLNL